MTRVPEAIFAALLSLCLLAGCHKPSVPPKPPEPTANAVQDAAWAQIEALAQADEWLADNAATFKTEQEALAAWRDRVGPAYHGAGVKLAEAVNAALGAEGGAYDAVKVAAVARDVAAGRRRGMK